MNSTPPELAIAILDVYPRGYPADCLDMLLKSDVPAGTPLLIISRRQNEAREAVEKLRPERRFGAAEVIPVDGDVDIAAARNLAFTRGVTPHVLMIGSDVLLTRDSIEPLFAVLRNQPRVAAAGALIYKENGWPRVSALPFPRLRHQLGRPLRFLRQRFPRHTRYRVAGLEVHGMAKVEALAPTCYVVRRQAWEEVGPFTEGYDFGVETLEWCMRAALRGPQGGWHCALHAEAKAILVAPQERLPLPLSARIAYEESLLRCMCAVRGERYWRRFRRWRRWRVRRTLFLCRLAWILTAGCSHLANHGLEAYGGLADWYRRGCPPEGDAGDAISTRRWESLLV